MKTITVDLIRLKDAAKINYSNVASLLDSLKNYSKEGYAINVIEEVIVDPGKNLKYQRDIEKLETPEEVEEWIKREFE